jgi:hypothetical protein
MQFIYFLHDTSAANTVLSLSLSFSLSRFVKAVPVCSDSHVPDVSNAILSLPQVCVIWLRSFPFISEHRPSLSVLIPRLLVMVVKPPCRSCVRMHRYSDQ